MLTYKKKGQHGFNCTATVLSNDVRFNNNQPLHIFTLSPVDIVDMKYRPNIGLMLGHRFRRCPNINTT